MSLKELTEAAEQLFRFLNSAEDFQAAQQKQFKGFGLGVPPFCSRGLRHEGQGGRGGVVRSTAAVYTEIYIYIYLHMFVFL